jgi:hypothetical protein
MMRMLTIAAVVLTAATFRATSAGAAPDAGRVVMHPGMCEPSGAVAMPQGGFGQFLVANDEDNQLRAYESGDGRLVPLEGGDFGKAFGLDPTKKRDKADIEAATWLAGRTYWIGSHSRNSDGEMRKARWQIFSADVRAQGGGLAVAVGRSNSGLPAALAALDATLAEAIDLGDEKDKDLAAEKDGFNLEGLAARPDGSALVGLRNPLKDGAAILVPIVNLAEVVETSSVPVLGAPVMLPLGGRGVRSLEWSAAANAFFIAAGPPGSEGDFAVFRWSGAAGDDPTMLFRLADLDGLDDFHPEALIVDDAGRRLLLISDDGDRLVDGGMACNEIDDPEKQHFRSVVVTLD